MAAELMMLCDSESQTIKLPGITFMNKQAQVIWQTLEFRTAAMLQSFSRLSESQLLWQPPNGANTAAWLLWHIAEVEDNWVRDKIYGQPRRFPFAGPVRDVATEDYPSKSELLEYFHEVRAQSRDRLEKASEEEFDRPVDDEGFGRINVRGVWIGAATSCSWHGGQLVLLANRLIPA